MTALKAQPCSLLEPDLDEARRFYGRVLGCREGRSTDSWVDFDFFGHQISLHLGAPFATAATGKVGSHLVPMPHFGIILLLPEWQAIAQRLQQAGAAFVLEPQVRFAGEPGVRCLNIHRKFC